MREIICGLAGLLLVSSILVADDFVPDGVFAIGSIAEDPGNPVVPCGEGTCLLDLSVTCDGVDTAVSLEVHETCPEPEEEGEEDGCGGTIVIVTGGGGTRAFDEQCFNEEGELICSCGGVACDPPGDLLAALQADGYRTVQVRWTNPGNGWLQAPPGVRAGPAALGCRPATLMTWIHNNVVPATERGTRGFCATGNSAGADQVLYPLTHYGLSPIVDRVVATAGPPFARIDLGCFSDPTEPFGYAPGFARFLADGAFGFVQPGAGPCEQVEGSPIDWRDYYRASQLSPIADLSLTTRLDFVWFQIDPQSATTHGELFEEAVAEMGTSTTKHYLTGSGHQTAKTQAGADAIYERLRDCDTLIASPPALPGQP